MELHLLHPPSSIHRTSVMVKLFDAYVVGLSVLLFYVLKIWFEGRGAWKLDS